MNAQPRPPHGHVKQGQPAGAPPRRELWLLLAHLDHPDASLVIPALAWMAEEGGALFEQYLEAPRDGVLFARTGSTVLGGRHHEAFAMLAARFDLRVIELGESGVFASTVAALGIPILAAADTAGGLYRAMMATTALRPARLLLTECQKDETRSRFAPYWMPDIFFGRALALRAEDGAADATGWARETGLELECLCVEPGDTLASFTRRAAERWRGQARGVAFGDPDAILSQLAWHCRHRRLPVYGERLPLDSAEVRNSHYTEARSELADFAAELALEVGDPVIAGRQTCDADILAWSERGCCIQITDPNRPPFPVIEEAPQPWVRADAEPAWTGPPDEVLAQWADEGKILATLVWHSGELAHNEAMLNLVELASTMGVCMGIGTHALRYATCPATWELLNVAVDRGGAAGLIEPVLHSGGRGVLAEAHCPPEALAAHCRAALEEIGRIAGRAGTPTGYYAFLDTDLATLTEVAGPAHAAIAGAGLRYVISSARPGRNCVLGVHGACLVLNQTPRVVHPASPFVRITGAPDLETAPRTGPGWLIASLDAPVRAFSPYIWRRGHEVIALLESIQRGRNLISATPHTIARYAALLLERRLLPTLSNMKKCPTSGILDGGSGG